MSSLSSSAIHLGGESVMGWLKKKRYKANIYTVDSILKSPFIYIVIHNTLIQIENQTYIFTRGSKFNNSRHCVKGQDNRTRKLLNKTLY